MKHWHCVHSGFCLIWNTVYKEDTPPLKTCPDWLKFSFQKSFGSHSHFTSYKDAVMESVKITILLTVSSSRISSRHHYIFSGRSKLFGGEYPSQFRSRQLPCVSVLYMVLWGRIKPQLGDLFIFLSYQFAGTTNHLYPRGLLQLLFFNSNIFYFERRKEQSDNLSSLSGGCNQVIWTEYNVLFPLGLNFTPGTLCRPIVIPIAAILTCYEILPRE